MRELTKSISSFSWAMSMFGLQQTANLLSPAKACNAFDGVAKASTEQLGEVLKTTFSTGDKLQRGAIDLLFGPLMGESSDPNRFVRMTTDAVQQSAEALTKGAREVTSTLRQAASMATPQDSGSDSSAASARRSGWGPMPS
jgi:hypothetical protein